MDVSAVRDEDVLPVDSLIILKGKQQEVCVYIVVI